MLLTELVVGPSVLPGLAAMKLRRLSVYLLKLFGGAQWVDLRHLKTFVVVLRPAPRPHAFGAGGQLKYPIRAIAKDKPPKTRTEETLLRTVGKVEPVQRARDPILETLQEFIDVREAERRRSFLPQTKELLDTGYRHIGDEIDCFLRRALLDERAVHEILAVAVSLLFLKMFTLNEEISWK
ncbi:hypothetical protein B0H17DRAFT_1135096 [Mycena rosella]|uniref:Uncharacterized protein n=1 Tax=Mycena rosella TaxID=1033263 RepID=A0AAD7DEB8_MYCRO|nr:hypothetical protein B0H17DRAFT_1135096 [Mycena rosella]